MLPNKKNLKYLGLSSIGIQFGLSVVIGVLGGYWLDGKFDTKPWLMVVGLILGVVAGIRSLVREINKGWQDTPDSEEQKGDERK